MRTYKLSLGLISLSLLLEGCSLFSIDPDEIDIADDDDVGTTELGTGDGDGDPAGTETGGTDEGSGTTTDADTTVNEAGSDTGDDTTGDTGTTGDTATTDGDTATTDGDSSDGTTGGACEDFLGINECGDCVSVECCDPLLACVADEVCFCTFNCQLDGGSEQACVEMCGPANDLAGDLNSCTAMGCGELCL